jgi:protein disulfide-isomerase A6
MSKAIITLALLLALASAFYETDSKVVKLTVANFQSEVLDSEDLWLIEFYAPWCGHCKKLAPHYDKAAKALDGIVKFGALDMTVDGEAAKDYNVTGYPTIKFFGTDKTEPAVYEGERKKGEIIDFMLDQARNLALSRLGIKGSSAKAEDANVVVLTDSNFEELVMNSQEPWFIKFYAPWCKHWFLFLILFTFQ